jgi:hypothetical protein
MRSSIVFINPSDRPKADVSPSNASLPIRKSTANQWRQTTFTHTICQNPIFKNTKNKVEIHGAFFRVLKIAPEKPRPPHKPPRSHHQLTTTKPRIFPRPPLKTAAKPQTEHSESICEFFPRQTPDSSASIADKDI